MVAGFFGWLYIPVPALSATVPPAHRGPAQPGLPWLSTADQRIVDSLGRSTVLRGFNDDALLESTVDPAPLDATDATLIEQSGFDVVRLPIAWSLLEPQRGQFDTAYIQRIVDDVAILNAHHLYAVLDMHFLGYSPVYGGSGAPAWATVPHVWDPVWGPMPSMARFLSPAINVSYTNFWLSSSLQNEYFAAWDVVAQRFTQDSGLAGYDLINEPHAFPLPPVRFDKDQLWPFTAHGVAAIGAVDPNHLFFIDNDMAADIPTVVVPLSAPNLVYSPHVYTGSLYPPPFSGDTHPLAVHINELASEASSVPAALWIGEFAINSHGPMAYQWINAILDDFAQHNAGWAWWQWRESTGYGVRSADGKSLDTKLLRVLARPFVAAQPSGVSVVKVTADSLDLTIAQSHDPAPAEVSWPAYLNGAPSMTSDCGAVGQWDPWLSRLQIVAPLSDGCTIHIA